MKVELQTPLNTFSYKNQLIMGLRLAFLKKFDEVSDSFVKKNNHNNVFRKKDENVLAKALKFEVRGK